MRAKEFITEAHLRTDNPGGSWIKHQQEDCIEAGTNQFGCPKRFGAVTGSYDAPVMLPVAVVAKCKGMRGEQANVRQDDLEWLTNHMKGGKLPPTERGTEYVPYIQVAYDGTPWVNEGNHRIMAAKALGWEWIPIELRYFAGGEEANGPLSPAKVAQWDAQGHGQR